MTSMCVYGFVAIIFVIRLYFLRVSKQNEARIVADGGREYGAFNSKLMAIVHVLIYFYALGEFYYLDRSVNSLTFIGMGLVVFSMYMLYMVSRLLSPIWTVKLMVAKNHQYVDHWLFRNIKHPNYFLNIVPELVGLILVCQAWYTALLLLPIYAIIMYIRIIEENKIIELLKVESF